MIITSIEQQKNRKNRYSVFINNQFAFGLDGADVLFFRLTEGAEISEEKKHDIYESCIYQKAMAKAVRLLSVRQRSEYELKKSLKMAEFDDDTTDRVINVLKDNGYINDEDFACEYAESMQARGLSQKAILYKLREKGLDRDITNGLDLGGTELQNCKKLVGKKYGEITKENKAKAFRYLMSKGFSPDTIKSVISATDEADDDIC